MTRLVGTGVALVTPFTKEGLVDLNALDQLVEHVIQGGVDYLVVLGTTAETATLTSEEREQVISAVVQANKGRLPLVLGVVGNATQSVVQELEQRDLSAFQAILSVSPYYNKPTQEGIYQHFKAIAQASPVPVILYNVPSRTGSNMLAGTTVRLAREFSNIIAIKEASGDLVQCMRILKDKPKDFDVISGDDMITLPLILAGGSGVISVLGQGVPRAFSEMVREGLRGNIDHANQLHYAMMDLMDLIFSEGNPAGIKSLLELVGIGTSTVRLPLVSASADLCSKIKASVSQLETIAEVS